jgi:hypothetical protein
MVIVLAPVMLQNFNYRKRIEIKIRFYEFNQILLLELKNMKVKRAFFQGCRNRDSWGCRNKDSWGSCGGIRPIRRGVSKGVEYGHGRPARKA